MPADTTPQKMFPFGVVSVACHEACGSGVQKAAFLLPSLDIYFASITSTLWSPILTTRTMLLRWNDAFRTEVALYGQIIITVLLPVWMERRRHRRRR